MNGKLTDLKYFKIGLLDRFFTDKGKCIDFACGKEPVEYVVWGQLPTLGCPAFCLCKECGDALLSDPELYLKNFHRYKKGLDDWIEENWDEGGE
jgi:hypothetical protein